MKFHKTPEKERGTYTYHFADGQTVTLKPDQNGVSELSIKKLHSLDDSEVYYNIKNSRPKQTDEVKSAIKDWEDKHHGEVAPKNWNISLDTCACSNDQDYASDKSKIMFETATTLFENDPPEDVSELREFITTLPQTQQELYKLKYIEEYTQTEIADILKISDAAVHNRIKRLSETIKNNLIKF